MKQSKFNAIQGYVRRTYSRLMGQHYGSQFCYTVESSVGSTVEVRLVKTRTNEVLGDPLVFHRAPRPSRGRAAREAEQRILEHLATAYGIHTLLSM